MKDVMIFLAGAAIGGVAVWFYQEYRYEAILNEEIEEPELEDKIEDYIKNDVEVVNDVSDALKKIAEENVNKPDLNTLTDFVRYSDKIEKYNYAKKVDRIDEEVHDKDSLNDEPESIEENKEVEKPYIIDQAEFREFDDYKHITLDRYTDGIIVDADYPDDPLDNPEEIVGNCLKKVPVESYEDWIFIRNDAKKMDIEVFINSIEFSEREDR